MVKTICPSCFTVDDHPQGENFICRCSNCNTLFDNDDPEEQVRILQHALRQVVDLVISGKRHENRNPYFFEEVKLAVAVLRQLDPHETRGY